MQKRSNNDHDYDSPSLEFAYVGSMRKNMPHICSICSIRVAYMRCIFRQTPHIFPHILPPKVPHILRKFFATNQHLYLVISFRGRHLFEHLKPRLRCKKSEILNDEYEIVLCHMEGDVKSLTASKLIGKMHRPTV